MTTQDIPLILLTKSKYIVEFRQISRRSELHVFRDKRINERVTRSACHVEPKERTLGTLVEAKCHTSILHERIVVGKWA